MYPGFYSPRIGPRMIQPIPRDGDVNVLPEKANFVQSYPKYKKSKADSKFGALVRIIEFEYDIKDTFTIFSRITTGYDEGEMTGLVTILIDQYELTYEDKLPQVRDYVEEVSYESSRPVQQTQQIHNPITTANQKKQTQVVNRSQLYNSAKFNLEDEDVRLMARSKTLTFILHLQNAEIAIYPSKEQIKILKRMIRKHYSSH